MVRSVSWVVLGCLCVALAGCGGGDSNPPPANNNNNGAPVAGGPPPGMGGGAPAGGMPAGGAPAAAPAAPAAPATPAAAKDPLVYMPANVTFAVGGSPAAVTKSTNKVAAAFLEQFSPLTSTLARFGLPAQNFESFWAAGTADLSEQALCVVTSVDINQEAIKLVLGGANLPKDSKVWPLPGDAGSTHALAIADARTVIIGRKTTVEAAIRKSPAIVIKQGLGTINQIDADFWMAGDSAAAETYLASGLPLLGSYRKPLANLKAFGVSMILEGKTLTPNPTNIGAAGGDAPVPGMIGMTAPPGMSMSAPAPGVGPPNSMPAGFPGATGGAATPAVPAAPQEQNGVIVMVGLVFEAEDKAVAIKVPLDAFLTSAAKKKGPKSGRFVPDLFGAAGGAAGGGGGGANAAMMMMMASGPGANPAGGSAPPGSAGGGAGAANSVPTVLEPPAAASLALDAELKLFTPPTPLVVSATPPAADGAAAPAAAAAAPATGTGAVPGGAPPGFVIPSPASAGAPAMATTGPGSAAYQAMMNGTAGGGSGGNNGNTGFAGQWIQQQGTIAQFGYRFSARDHNVGFASHLLRALGTSPLGDPLSSGPLAALHKAADQWRTAGATGAGKNGFGPQGASWMVHLLPYIGHEGLYKQFDFSKPLTDPKNIKLTHTIIPEFLNPADPRQQWSGGPNTGMGLTHFVGMSGVEDESGIPAARLPRNDPKAGIFGYDGVATPDMITDGQAQTIMMVGSGEIAAPWAVGGGATIRGARPKSFAPHSGFGSAGGPKPGAFVLFADGSVRFVAADVDEQVFKAMSTTHGKETVDLQGLQSAGSLAGK